MQKVCFLRWMGIARLMYDPGERQGWLCTSVYAATLGELELASFLLQNRRPGEVYAGVPGQHLVSLTGTGHRLGAGNEGTVGTGARAGRWREGVLRAEGTSR